MIYGIVTFTFVIGWHEIYAEKLIRGKSLFAMSIRTSKIAHEWFDHDDGFTPTVIPGRVKEISKQDFDILRKYISIL